MDLEKPFNSNLEKKVTSEEVLFENSGQSSASAAAADVKRKLVSSEKLFQKCADSFEGRNNDFERNINGLRLRTFRVANS